MVEQRLAEEARLRVKNSKAAPVRGTASAGLMPMSTAKVKQSAALLTGIHIPYVDLPTCVSTQSA